LVQIKIPISSYLRVVQIIFLKIIFILILGQITHVTYILGPFWCKLTAAVFGDTARNSESDCVSLEHNARGFFENGNPTEWYKIIAYRIGVHLLRQVVNDVAERGMKLISDFDDKITKDEEQKQSLMQMVYDYRRKYPDKKRSTYVKVTKKLRARNAATQLLL
jgi:hypothetical protein